MICTVIAALTRSTLLSEDVPSSSDLGLFLKATEITKP